ncbi:hypothetical protein ACMZZG_23620 [Pseudocitrobacter faecalis]|uniref:hypothetical protein n=1 Tax=Pseudocitrobacter faecalis TaxID=1398493 RepID=UPI0039EE7A6F
MIRLWDYLNDVAAPPAVVKRLAEMALAAMDAEPVADVVAWHKEGEERTCDIRWRRFDVAPGPLFAVAQPVAVVPDEMTREEYKRLFMEEDDFDDTFRGGWNACRATMLNHSEHERDMVKRVSQPYKLSFDQWMSQQEGSIDVECGCVMTEVLFHWMRVAYEAGNSPEIPDGWVIVPKELTCEMDDAAWEAYHETRSMSDIWAALLASAPQQEMK